MMIMIPTTLNTCHIYQNTVKNNSSVSTPVLLLKLHNTGNISVTETQNLYYLHQYKNILNDKVVWYDSHIIFQNSV